MFHKVKLMLGISILSFLMVVNVVNARTFLRAEVLNSADVKATGFEFMMLTDGSINDAVVWREGQVQNHIRPVRNDAVVWREGQVQSHTRPALLDARAIKWDLPHGIPAGDRIGFSVEFTTAKYWETYFTGYFTYESKEISPEEGTTFPYAAFFVNYTPTSEPNKFLASLTVVNNIAARYDLKNPYFNEAKKGVIVFEKSHVYVDNDLSNYTINKFYKPTGRRANLPESFTLHPGEARTFDLGIVKAGTYVATSSIVSYENSLHHFSILCAHAQPK